MRALGVYTFHAMEQMNIATAAAATGSSDGNGIKSGPPELARAIRLMIRDGEYGPGDRLGTAELADRLNVSRGPVREALRLLESRRLVRIEQNRGAFVIDLQDKEALDAFATRGVLFAFLAELCAVRASDAQIAAMKSKLAELSDLHSHGRPTPRSFLKATFRIVQIFHEAAATPSGILEWPRATCGPRNCAAIGSFSRRSPIETQPVHSTLPGSSTREASSGVVSSDRLQIPDDYVDNLSIDCLQMLGSP